uniref:non-specific serine/threonine protein kinase n=1 Tax=Leersia perrieri TaxID=77586 RepID=A0A0D9WKH5_9ORYZ
MRSQRLFLLSVIGQGFSPNSMGAGRSVPARDNKESGGCWGWRRSNRAMSSTASSSPHYPAHPQPEIENSVYNGNIAGGEPFLPEDVFSGSISPSLVAKDDQLRRFSYYDLICATGHFRPDNFLGIGGFGPVHKGWIRETGTSPARHGTGLPVAVKTLSSQGMQGHPEWVAEIHYLRTLRHPNLVKLFGFCIEGNQRQLVYEFMSRGSLDKLLFNVDSVPPLPWNIRVKILLGAAKGLAYLHEETETPVIFRDFKTSNVLLDEDYNAKLSDFGLARDGPEGDRTHVSTQVVGTHGYGAPEYVMTGHLNTKSDVYSFGAVVLEMLSGRKAMDKSRPMEEQNLAEWARPFAIDRERFHKLIDRRLGSKFSITGSQMLARLGHNCTNLDPKSRPIMSKVVTTLETIINLDDMATNTNLYHQMLAERAHANANANLLPASPTLVVGSSSANSQPSSPRTMRSPARGPNPRRSTSSPYGPHGPVHSASPFRPFRQERMPPSSWRRPGA